MFRVKVAIVQSHGSGTFVHVSHRYSGHTLLSIASVTASVNGTAPFVSCIELSVMSFEGFPFFTPIILVHFNVHIYPARTQAPRSLFERLVGFLCATPLPVFT